MNAMGNSVCGRAFDSSVVITNLEKNKMNEIFEKVW
jgi:hypothetical protein